MVNLMLDLFVNHIVEDYPAIDYIAIKTKKGEEGHTISDSVKERVLKKVQKLKKFKYLLKNFSGRKEDVGFWLQQMVFHFSDTDEYYHLPITHDYKLILE